MTLDTSRFEAASHNAKVSLAEYYAKHPCLTEAQSERLYLEIQRLRGLERKYARSKPSRSGYYRRKADAAQRELSRNYSPMWRFRRATKHFGDFVQKYYRGVMTGWMTAFSALGRNLHRFNQSCESLKAASQNESSQVDVVSELLEISDALRSTDQPETCHTPGTDTASA